MWGFIQDLNYSVQCSDQVLGASWMGMGNPMAPLPQNETPSISTVPSHWG